MAIIPLSQGQFAIVDDEDYEILSRWKWHAAKPNKSRPFYARRTVREGKRSFGVWMHRQILGLKPGDKVLTDHENGNTLDNRRSNLRRATFSQNNANRTSNKKYKGVRWHPVAKKWQARIKKNRKEIYLGLFPTPEAAHAMYCEAAARLHGEFARTK